MPSKTKKQHNLMAAVANNPAFAKKVGIPQSVGKEFVTADKGKTFKEGGHMAVSKMGKPVMKKGMSTAKEGMKKPTPMANTAMAGSAAPAMPMGMGMKKGGMPMVMKDGKKVPAFAVKKMASGGSASSRADGIAQRGKTKGKMMAKGGRTC